MFNKNFKKNKSINGSNIRVKRATVLPLISIIFVIAIIAGFISFTSYSIFYAANLKNKFSSNVSLVSFCQTNQCVANITSKGY
jgi:RNA recognition motif-containing protein